MEGSPRRRRGSPAPARGRIRTVPIAVTPEGFWCCPSPAALQKKSLKNPHHNHNKQPTSPKQRSKVPSSPSPPPVPSPPPKAPSAQQTAPSVSVATDEAAAPADEQRNQAAAADVGTQQHEQQQEEGQHKICVVGFGQVETSDLTVMLYGKEGVAVRMTVHRDVLRRSSVFFADKLGHSPPPPPCCLEIHDCDDAEIYVETVGLMYCYDEEAKHKLLKQSVPRVLRIMKVAELLGFHACVKSCLEYLEAVPWVGEEEEDEVVSSIQHLRITEVAYAVSPVLKRVQAAPSSVDNLTTSCSPGRDDTLARIVEMVLTSTDDRGRRDMKALVLNLFSKDDGDGDGRTCSETMLYRSCRGCLDRLEETLFAEASSSPGDDELSTVDVITTLHRRRRMISLETDNLLWLVEILMHRRTCDEFVAMWTRRTHLAELHSKLPAPAASSGRHGETSRVTARLFVGIGRGEVLVPSTTVRLLLLRVWLPPLIDDYSWLLLQSSFDRRTVDDGIGQTILTLPLDDQRSVLLDWLGRFLALGDRNCPNLLRAFEVWWRRTFVRPAYVSHAQAGNVDALSSDSLEARLETTIVGE